MGGGGGGYFSDIDPENSVNKIRDSEKKTKDVSYETDVNGYLTSELSIFNNRDTEAVKEILDNLKNDLKDQVDGTVNLLFGGSISKHTYVDGLSDIDALVIFEKKDFFDSSPQELKKLLKQNLSERYGEKNVKIGNLAVTVNLNGMDIQLLPAQRIGDSFKICSYDGKKWSKIRPNKFAELLTKMNQKNGGKVIPTVKLVKAIISTLPEKQRLSGYHIESLAVEIFKSYSGPLSPKSMVTKFFDRAPSFIKSTITDSTGQSVYVDEYLGPKNSTNRRVAIMAIDRIARKIKNADGMRSVDGWKVLLGEK